MAMTPSSIVGPGRAALHVGRAESRWVWNRCCSYYAALITPMNARLLTLSSRTSAMRPIRSANVTSPSPRARSRNEQNEM